MDSCVVEIPGTFRPLHDWLKALLVVVPPAFLLGLLAIVLHHRRAVPPRQGKMLYSVSLTKDGELVAFSHEPEPHEIGRPPAPVVPGPRPKLAASGNAAGGDRGRGVAGGRAGPRAGAAPLTARRLCPIPRGCHPDRCRTARD